MRSYGLEFDGPMVLGPYAGGPYVSCRYFDDLNNAADILNVATGNFTLLVDNDQTLGRNLNSHITLHIVNNATVTISSAKTINGNLYLSHGGKLSINANVTVEKDFVFQPSNALPGVTISSTSTFIINGSISAPIYSQIFTGSYPGSKVNITQNKLNYSRWFGDPTAKILINCYYSTVDTSWSGHVKCVNMESYNVDGQGKAWIIYLGHPIDSETKGGFAVWHYKFSDTTTEVHENNNFRRQFSTFEPTTAFPVFRLPTGSANPPTENLQGGEVYYNTVEGVVRYFDAVNTAWTNM